MNARTWSILLSVTFAGCTGTLPGDRDVVSGRIEGRLLARYGPSHIEVVSLPPQVNAELSGSAVCAENVAEGGRFSCDIGPAFGLFRVRLSPEEYSVVETVVEIAAPGEVLRETSISPLTDFLVALTQARMREGLELSSAYEEATRMIDGHFGGIDHARTMPVVPGPETNTVTPASTAGLLVVVFDRLAGRILDRADSVATGNRLVAMLRQDILADGRLDGNGPEGPLALEGRALGATTLRARYGRALLDWLDSDENESALTSKDYRGLAEALSSRASPLFANDGSPLDEAPPRIQALALVDEHGRRFPIDRPVGGAPMYLEAEVGDENGGVALSAELESDESIDLDAAPERVRLRLPVAVLVEGEHAVRFVAEDGSDNRMRTSVAFAVDHTPPSLEATAAGRPGEATIVVSGSIEDVSGPGEEVTIETAVERKTFAVSVGGKFEGTVSAPCDQATPVVVRVKDAADNIIERALEAICDTEPPDIRLAPSSFYAASDLDARYAEDGSSVSYTARPGRQPVVIDEAMSRPLVVEAYLNRLDDGAENLPVIRLAVSDEVSGVDLSYRYLVDGVVERGWSALPVGENGSATVALSYQSLSAKLGWAPDDAEHLVELRAVDGVGNETYRGFPFQLHGWSPPIGVYGCGIPESLKRFSLSAHNLHELYQDFESFASAEMRIVQRWDLPPNSLSPVGPAVIELSTPTVSSQITELREDKHPGPVFDPAVNTYPLNCPTSGPHHMYTEADLKSEPIAAAATAATCAGLPPSEEVACLWAHCQPGEKPLDEALWSVDADGELPELPKVFHEAKVRLMRGDEEAERQANGTYVLVPDVEHLLFVDVYGADLVVASEVYAWPREFEPPDGFRPVASASGSPYRFPGLWRRRGADRIGHTLSLWWSEPYIAAVQIDTALPKLGALVPYSRVDNSDCVAGGGYLQH